MKNRAYLILLLLLGISNNNLSSNSISELLIGHWFVVEKNHNYSSGESVNCEEKVIYNFIFKNDGTGFWMVETEKIHSTDKSEKNNEKFNYKWKVQDDKLVFNFYEMSRTLSCNFDFSDSILTLTDPENNTRKFNKK